MSTANLRVEDRSAIAAVNDLSLAEAAEAYASAGIPVLPLKPRDKLPLTPHGHLDATTDIQKIREWWERWTNANIGIVPGDNAGFLVIDIDGPEGAQTLTKLEAMHSALPATLTSQTARGRHLLYANPNGLKAGNAALGPKVDVRSNSGYIVAPPSIHPSGHRYQWMADVLIAPIPKWLRTVLANKSAPAATQTGDGQILILPEQRKIAEGGRNAALASIAGDENPFLLAVANGTIDLRSGELRQSRREDFMTKSLSVEYDRNATAPRWIEFVEEITQGDIALAEFLQRLLGYCLTGDTSEQCLFILHGHGANGKSTLLEVVHELLGPYSAKTP
jgi:Bifunctional DNA primase/polymerase, N-terminal/D5 N terminal like